MIKLSKEMLTSTYCEGEWKLSSTAIHSGVGGDGNLAMVSMCFIYFSVTLVWVLLSTPRAGSWVLRVLCAALRSTSTSMGSLAAWKASTAWSWVVAERLLPFTYAKKRGNLNENEIFFGVIMCIAGCSFITLVGRLGYNELLSKSFEKAKDYWKKIL